MNKVRIIIGVLTILAGTLSLCLGVTGGNLVSVAVGVIAQASGGMLYAAGRLGD